MSYQAQNWAVRITVGSATAKAILLLIANYADEAGSCFPSQDRLAKELELSERAVRDGLARLESMGIIRRERRHDPDGFRTSDRIHLNASYRKEMPVGRRGLPEGGSGNEGKLDRPTGKSPPRYRQEVPPNHQNIDTSLRSVSPPVSPTSNVVALKRKTRLPDSFVLTDQHLAYAARHGLSEEETRHEFEKFTNHFAGSGDTKLDWNRTLQNWFLRAAERNPRQAALARGGQKVVTEYQIFNRVHTHLQDRKRDDGGDEVALPF